MKMSVERALNYERRLARLGARHCKTELGYGVEVVVAGTPQFVFRGNTPGSTSLLVEEQKIGVAIQFA
jgi:hypothetical protein